MPTETIQTVRHAGQHLARKDEKGGKERGKGRDRESKRVQEKEERERVSE